MKLLKFLKVYSTILLLLALMISIDLGFNCLGAAIPEIQDGLAYHSFLQSHFGLLENMGITTRVDFFYAFKLSVSITFIVLVWNTVLSFIKVKK